MGIANQVEMLGYRNIAMKDKGGKLVLLPNERLATTNRSK